MLAPSLYWIRFQYIILLLLCVMWTPSWSCQRQPPHFLAAALVVEVWIVQHRASTKTGPCETCINSKSRLPRTPLSTTVIVVVVHIHSTMLIRSDFGPASETDVLHSIHLLISFLLYICYKLSKEVFKWNCRQYEQLKSRGEKNQKRTNRKREDQKWKRQKKEDTDARKGRQVAIHCVFPIICGSGRSNSRLAKAAGAEPAGQMRDEKVHAVVAQSTFPSQNVQNTPGPNHFWKLSCRNSARGCGAKHILK